MVCLILEKRFAFYVGDELDFLEKSISRTGRLAMKPSLMMERKDLRQMQVIDR